MFALAGLVVCAVIGMATGSWAWFGIALAVHLIGSAIVITNAVRSAQRGSEADESSEQLDEIAARAGGPGPRNQQAELEALKRSPPQPTPE